MWFVHFFCICQWTQLKTRKQNLTRLFQKMQSYQFEQISADPDKPLADGIRPLDTADMERYVWQHQKNKYICYSLLLQIQNMRNNFWEETVLLNHCCSSVRFFYIFFICRLKDVQTLEELGDVYNHFLLYYGRDIPKMQNAAKANKKRLKKIKEVSEDGKMRDE